MATELDDPVIRPQREETALKTLRAIATATIDTIEAAARQVITVAAVLLGVYYNASTGANLASHPVGVRLTFLTPVVCWIASLVCSVVALHPRAWRVRLTSEVDAKEDVERLRKHKHRWYMRAIVLLVVGTACMLVVLALRLNLLPYRFEIGS